MSSLSFTKPKRAAIIYNPFAGRLARTDRSLQRTTQILAQSGIEATLIPTLGPRSASAQTREQIEAGCELIIAAGGDGTINEAANGMLHSRVPLAILPGGTANVLARELGMSLQLSTAASQIASLEPLRISAGVARVQGWEDRIFLLMAGVGLDAQIVYNLDLDLKAMAGKLAYYIGGFGQVFRPIQEFEVRVDGKSYAASFALISRVRNYGGDFEIARGASLLRGDFEIVLFQGRLSVEYLRYLVGVTFKFAHKLKGCLVMQGRTVECRAASPDTVYVQTDGELIGSLPFSAEIIPEALTLLVPREYSLRERNLLRDAVCA